MTKQAFISHISEEAMLAGRLKTALKRDFLGFLEVFVSSDPQNITAGEDWLHSIEKALEKSALLIILCSPSSIKRPWINFEAGAAWMRHIPLVPICHAGLSPNGLPILLSLRQGVSLEQPEGLRRLYGRIAEELKCQVPSCSFDDLAVELTRSAASGIQAVPASLSASRSTTEIDSLGLKILKAIANHKKDFVYIETLRDSIGEGRVVVRHHLDVLTSAGLLEYDRGNSLVQENWQLTGEGRGFVVRQGLVS